MGDACVAPTLASVAEGEVGLRSLHLPGFQVLLHVFEVLADVGLVGVEPVVEGGVAVLGVVGGVGPGGFGQGPDEGVGFAAQPLEQVDGVVDVLIVVVEGGGPFGFRRSP